MASTKQPDDNDSDNDNNLELSSYIASTEKLEGNANGKRAQTGKESTNYTEVVGNDKYPLNLDKSKLKAFATERTSNSILVEVLHERYYIYVQNNNFIDFPGDNRKETTARKHSISWLQRIAAGGGTHADIRKRFMEEPTMMDLLCVDTNSDESYTCKVIEEPLGKVQEAYKRIFDSEQRFSSLHGHLLLRSPKKLFAKCPQSTYVIIDPKVCIKTPTYYNANGAISDGLGELHVYKAMNCFPTCVHESYQNRLDTYIKTAGVPDIAGTSAGSVYLNVDDADLSVYEDLHTYIRNVKRLTEAEARGLFHQMAELVLVCHKNGIILRDIKLKRFYFIDRQRTKLQYESLSGAIILDDPSNDLVSKKVGCPFYTAPEIFNVNRSYNGKAADIWALGVVLYTMVTGHYPFYESSNTNLIRMIRTCDTKMPLHLSNSLKMILNQTLRRNVAYRLPIEGLFLTSWLKAQLPLYKQIKVKVAFIDDDIENMGDKDDNDSLLFTDHDNCLYPPVVKYANINGRRRGVAVSISGSALNNSNMF